MIDIAKLKQTVGELNEELVEKMLDEFLAGNPQDNDARKVLEACQQGMEIVGANFEKGKYFIGDLITAGELLTAVIGKLKPVLGEGTVGQRGLIVLGTVEGDIHDIGKDIFKGMAEAAGFTVVDIGIDQPPKAFVDAVKANKPVILGMSGVLKLAIDSMKRTIEALKEAGLRNDLKIIIGGVAVSPEACVYSGADAWTTNAAEGAKICGNWV